MLIRMGAALLLATLESAAVSAQLEDVRARMGELLRYTGVENLPAGDVARMAELWARAQQPGLVSALRLAARPRLSVRPRGLSCESSADL